MSKIISFLLLIFVLTYSGCDSGKIIKDQAKFASIYVDLLITQETNKGNHEVISKERKRIYDKYGISDEQFNATISYYDQDPEKWNRFFAEVNKRISELKKVKDKKSS